MAYANATERMTANMISRILAICQVKIFVYENMAYTYTVIIMGSVFEMSANANQPDGLNMYMCEECDFNGLPWELIEFNSLSDGTKEAIINRCLEYLQILTENAIHRK